MDVMNNISYVKAKPISGKKASVLKDVRQAVEEMHLIKEGKLEARDAQEFLRELKGQNDSCFRKTSQKAC